MATTPAPSTDPTARDPDHGALTRQLDALAVEYGNRFLHTWASADATFTLNFSTGASIGAGQVLQNFVRFGHDGYRYHGDHGHGTQPRSRSASPRRASSASSGRMRSSCRWSRSGSTGSTTTTSSTSRRSSAAERGWMVPAYTLPPNADHVKIMRALVKLTLGHTLATHAGRRHRRGLRRCWRRRAGCTSTIARG